MRRGSTRPSAVDLDATVDDGRGRKLSWRRVNANAEGLVDLSALAGGDSEATAVPSISTRRSSRRSAQKARLVLDTPAEAAAWVNGKPVTLSGAGATRAGRGPPTLELAQGPGRS